MEWSTKLTRSRRPSSTKLSVAVQKFHSDTNSDTPQPFVGFSGFFTNLGSLPGPATFNQINDQATFNILDNATKTAGSWSFKFGAQIQFNRLDGWLRPQQEFEFGSFNDLEADQPFLLSKIGFPGFYENRNSNWDLYAEERLAGEQQAHVQFGVRPTSTLSGAEETICSRISTSIPRRFCRRFSRSTARRWMQRRALG